MAMNIMKVATAGGAVLLISVFILRDARAASDDFSSLCTTAGGKLYEEKDPSYYLESLTKQNTMTRLYFPSGDVFALGDFTASGWTDGQRIQANRLKDLARMAFLYSYPVSLCVDNSTSPNTVWMLELREFSSPTNLNKERDVNAAKGKKAPAVDPTH